MTTWNPDLYLKFEAERTQPAIDLAARIDLTAPARIIDIGCGPGNSTRVLRERWPAAQVSGLDRSPEMIAKARQACPQGEWITADAARWSPDALYSLVFSNAALQWIPDQRALLPRLFAAVEPGGALAVQVPANTDSPLYQAVQRVAQRPPWQERLAGCDQALTYRDAAFYYDILSSLSSRVSLWDTTYYHVLASRQGLIEWYSSTGLRPYLERLAENDLQQAFKREILAECQAAYPLQQDGKVLFPFRRLFFIAYQAS